MLQHRIALKDVSMLALNSKLQAMAEQYKQALKSRTEEEGSRVSMINDMHDQRARMEAAFNEKLSQTRANVSNTQAELAALKTERAQSGGQKDNILETKQAEITALSLKIETLAYEFSEMMREVIDKLSERMDVTHSSGDQVGRLPLLMQIENRRTINLK